MREVELLEQEWHARSELESGSDAEPVEGAEPKVRPSRETHPQLFPPPELDQVDYALRHWEFSDEITSSYLLNFFSAKTVPGLKKKRAAAAGGEKEGGGDKKKEEKSPEVQKSLALQRGIYSPFELLTSMRRKTQIVLLQELGRDVQHNFNLKFQSCQEEKKEAMGHIKEKLIRMRSILSELGLPDDLEEPKLTADEVPESVLEVRDEEVPVPKYLTEEEKKALEEKKRKEADTGNDKTNEAGKRALMQMMGGKCVWGECWYRIGEGAVTSRNRVGLFGPLECFENDSVPAVLNVGCDLGGLGRGV